MKKNIFKRAIALVAMAIPLAFFSCSTEIDDSNSAAETGEKASVTFNISEESSLKTASRAVSTVNLEDYKYTITAKNSNGEETSLCEKEEASSGSITATIVKGTYTFTATGYKDEAAILSGTSEAVTISSSSSSVPIVLTAVKNGSANVKITLKISDSLGITSAKAGLFDKPEDAVAPESNLDVDSTTNEGYKTVTFSKNSVESGSTKYVVFFLYDSENNLQPYFESVYVVNGADIDETLTLNTETISSTKLTGVKISAKNDKKSITSGAETTLTATPALSGTKNPEITYKWEITSGSDYAELTPSDDGKTATVKGKNGTTKSKSVKVKVTATSSGDSVEVEITLTVEPVSGTVSISVEVDGSVACGKCGKKYDTKAEAEKCEHYKCETCGTVYYSEEDLAACTKHVTVVFNDVTEEGYTSKTSVTVTIKSGDKIPDSVVKEVESWTRDGKVVTWLDSDGKEADLTAALSVDESETAKTVTFTAQWSTAHKVVFKNGEETVKELDVADGETIAETDIPTLTKEHYTLSWSSGETDVTTTSKITKDVTFTAVWTEDAKFTVTFTDSDSSNGNNDVTQTVYSGEKATAPTWKKDNYTLSWSSSVEGLSTDSEITADVTFTANWTENAKYTVTFEDSDGTNTTVTQTVYEGKNATVPAWTKEGFNLTWTSSVSGLTPASAITANVTFTATWSKDATSWTAGDATTPSWISGLGTAKSTSYTAFSTQNGSAFKSSVAIADKETFTITPTVAGTYVIYICRDDNTKTGTVTAKNGEATLGTYDTKNRKTADMTPWSLAVSSDYIGKAITFTVKGKALLFKVDIQ